MPIYMPDEAEEPETPEEPLEVEAFKESSIAVSEHFASANGRKPVTVTFNLSRPPSATEVRLAARQHRWDLVPGVAELSMDEFDSGNVKNALDALKQELVELTEKARRLEEKNAQVVERVTASLSNQLPAV